MFIQRITLVILLLVAAAAPAAAQDKKDEEADKLAEFIKSSYTKYEYEIPVRDGTKLFTAVYVPKDDSRSYAIMLKRTPYSVRPYGVDQYPRGLGPSERFAREGFIFAYQDVRGRFMSEGEFIEMTPHRPEKSGPTDFDGSSDTYDTIEWLVKNVPNNNGKVGMWGVSYPGFYTAAGMIDAHPALAAASPQAPMSDLYRGDDCYHNGAFFLAANFGFFTFFEKHEEPTRPTPKVPFDYQTRDGYEFFLAMGPLSQADEKYFHHEIPYWTDLIDHTTYDQFWRERNLTPHIDNVPPAVMTVGGWFDAEDLIGPLNVFHAIEENDPKTSNHLVMGPWSHGGWSWGDGDRLGDVGFNSKTSEFYREKIEFPFFDYHLNGNGEAHLPKAWVFETGTHRWRRFDTWPPRSTVTRRLYFRAGGELSFEPPVEESADDEYMSDPARPVPFVDYITHGMPQAYMVGDQRFAAKRTDVLVYQTDPLTEDITVLGPVSPELWVSTSGTDSDFVVKLIDVYPHDYPDNDPNPADVSMGGYQQLVRGEPFRAKFRNSLEQPEPMVPGQLTRIAFTMPDIAHVFRRGHRIMVQVQSSWFPLVDRNPQTFVDIPRARPEDFKKTTQRVARSMDASSSIGVLVQRK
jgi:putative CocE/NonD family hydrolase